MDLNNNCCKTHTLKKVKELYTSNVDEFTLYKCPDCQADWLYRKIEENWMDNLRFDWNDYEAWYIKIAKEDLEKVLRLEFEKILFNANAIYISSDGKIPNMRFHS